MIFPIKNCTELLINFYLLISNLDPCGSFPCKNGGKCLVENGQFKCKCTLPFFGSVCEHKRNPCSHDLCLNGGTCTPRNDFFNFTFSLSYTCSCHERFQGSRCQTLTGKIFNIKYSKPLNSVNFGDLKFVTSFEFSKYKFIASLNEESKVY